MSEVFVCRVCVVILATEMPWLHVKENYFKIYNFSFRRRPSAIMLFQRVENCLKLFQNYISEAYCSSWIFSNMFNVAEVMLK